MTSIVALQDASSADAFGGKAASLAKALRAGLPVPGGFAISWDSLDDRDAIADAYRTLNAERVAVRSSAIGEDSAEASFAGQHATVLNVTSLDALFDALVTVRDSAHSDAAREYRKTHDIAGEPRIAVVVQIMVESDIAGVLFTRDPVTGKNERVIESTWGLGEAVVAGLVTPDRFRLEPSGRITHREVGSKPFAIRYAPNGGTQEVRIPDLDARRFSLTDAQLAELHALGKQCEKFFGAPQDLEWAIAGGALYLLQSRPITTAVTLPLRSFTGLALAAVLAPLNSTIIAVALPSIADAFGASGSLVTRWLVTSYLVVAIAAQSPAGRIADTWGYSRMLTLGRALFGAGALLAAFSPQLWILGIGRVLMALGGALSIPTVFAQLRNSVPESSRGRVFGIFGAIMGTAAAIGPLIGGFLTTHFGWHSIFFVNIPVVALSLLLEPPRFEARPARASKFAGMSKALRAFGQLFTRRAFAAGSAIVALQNLVMYAMLFLLPFFLARTGFDASATGRMLLFFTVAMVLASPIGGRLSDSLGSRVVALSGATIGTAGASLFVAGGSLGASLVLLGLGIGVSTSPSQAAALGAIDASQAGIASGALSTMRYIGGVIGSGLVAVLATSPHNPLLWVFPAVLFASALASLSLAPQTVRR